MDTRTGEIMEQEELRRRLAQMSPGEREDAMEDCIKEVEFDNLPRRNQRELMKSGLTKLGRNQKCACGSGIKFRKCCLRGA